ncbi:MAG: GIY-YIG nuclease family protein [Patescibacteria group bacterium]
MPNDYYTYIMASESGTLYIGMTNDIERRVSEHKNDINECFTKRYQWHKLVHYEVFDNPTDAIAREKQIKRWRRDKKEILISMDNPGWKDLAEGF